MTNSHTQHGCGVPCSKIDSCMQCMQKEDNLQQRRGRCLASMWLKPRAARSLDPKPAAPQQTGLQYAIVQTRYEMQYEGPANVCIHTVHR